MNTGANSAESLLPDPPWRFPEDGFAVEVELLLELLVRVPGCCDVLMTIFVSFFFS